MAWSGDGIIMNLQIFSLVIVLTLLRVENSLPDENIKECHDDVCYKDPDESLKLTTPGIVETEGYPSTESNIDDTEGELNPKNKRNTTENEKSESTATAMETTTLFEEKFIVKVNFSTTATPPGESTRFRSSETEICLCDLTLNQCDINCCCDKDCSQIHYRVFTSCVDDSTYENPFHCYQSNYLFKNNTSHKMVKSKNSLFCIVKDNSNVNSDYRTKPIIKSVEEFGRSYNRKGYSFSLKSVKKFKFAISDYRAGLPVWVLQNKEVTEFGIPSPSIGYFCTSELKLRYLVDQVTRCSYQLPVSECGSTKLKKYFEYLKNLKVISNPGGVNKSISLNKVCESTSCLSVNSNLCYSSSVNLCIRLSDKLTEFGSIGCWNSVPKIQYLIAHNGSEGIKKFEVYVWLDNASEKSDENFLQTTEVKYSWIGAPQKSFKRSGNPGYITGKPLIAGSKVYHQTNATGEKKEAIEVSLDSEDWLTVLGSERGLCSLEKRLPVNFRENSHHSCLFPLRKELFGKEKCKELQDNIFRFLVGKEVLNVTTDNNLNKFVATFGNSKVEETGDWVQVLIDLSPVTSSQVGFKHNYDSLVCKNVITELYINVAFAKFGSFVNPQSKVLGVSFRFGPHKDLVFSCNSFACDNSSFVQYTKLSTMVHFLDETELPDDAFAVPLGLEVKLPHDFFYPFFSTSSAFQSSSSLLLSAVVFLFV